MCGCSACDVVIRFRNCCCSSTYAFVYDTPTECRLRRQRGKTWDGPTLCQVHRKNYHRRQPAQMLGVCSDGTNTQHYDTEVVRDLGAVCVRTRVCNLSTGMLSYRSSNISILQNEQGLGLNGDAILMSEEPSRLSKPGVFMFVVPAVYFKENKLSLGRGSSPTNARARCTVCPRYFTAMHALLYRNAHVFKRVGRRPRPLRPCLPTTMKGHHRRQRSHPRLTVHASPRPVRPLRTQSSDLPPSGQGNGL